MLEKQLHFTYRELQLLRMTAAGGDKATNISFEEHFLYMADLQAEAITGDTPTCGRLPESEMDYALRLLRALEHCAGDDIWEVLNMTDSRADWMEAKNIVWKVPFRVGKTFLRFKLLDAIEMLGPGELSCEQFLKAKTDEVLAGYEEGQR